MGRKNTIKKGRARRRKLTRTKDQRAQDDKLFACGRKKMYMSEVEAKAVADKLQHLAYLCSYSNGTNHWHTAHLPGSRRFVRGVPA